MAELAIIMIWWGIVTVVGLNGFAAGLAAILYLWRRGARRGPRIAWAAMLSGLMPASIFIPMAFTDREFIGGEGGLVAGLGFLMVLAIGTVLSVPGAIFVTRGLERPSEEFKFFE